MEPREDRAVNALNVLNGQSEPWASPWKPSGANPFEQVSLRTVRVNVTEPPASLVEEARQANPNVNGQLASLDRAELIAIVEKLQRRARTHRKTITELNAKHAEDMRQIANLQDRVRHAERYASVIDRASRAFNEVAGELDDD